MDEIDRERDVDAFLLRISLPVRPSWRVAKRPVYEQQRVSMRYRRSPRSALCLIGRVCSRLEAGVRNATVDTYLR